MVWKISAAAACLAGGLVALCPGQTYFVEAMVGDPLPGGLPGETITFVGSGYTEQLPPTLGENEVFYRVSTRFPDPNIDGRTHLRFGPVGAAQSVFLSGSLPFPPGVRMNLVDASIRITPDGHLVALGSLMGDGVIFQNNEAFLSRAPDGTMSVFRKGDQLSGEAPGTTLGGASSVAGLWTGDHRNYRAAPGGAVSVKGYFGSIINNQPTGRGSLLVVPGGESSVTARGFFSPTILGTPVEGGTIHEVLSSPPSVNGRGEQAFMYTFNPASGGLGSHIGIARQGSVQTVFRSGSPIYSHPGLLAYLSMGQVGWNDAGQVAFRGTAYPEGGSSARQAAFLLSDGGLTLLAQSGDPLPGRHGEVVPASMPSDYAPRLAADGSVAFDTGAGIWFKPAGADPRMLFCADSPARPTEIPDLRLLTSTLSINASGQAVAALARPNVSAASALVAYDPVLGEVLLAAVGRSLELRPGFVRQVSSINFTGVGDGLSSGAGQDGAPVGINARGQIAFGVTFTTGETAIIVATVPAPTSTAILLPGVLAALARRRNRGTLVP